MREDHLLKKRQVSHFIEWLDSSNIIENQNSLSASLEQESKMDPVLENLAMRFLPPFFLKCLAWEDKSRYKLMFQMQNPSKAVSVPAVAARGAEGHSSRELQTEGSDCWGDLPELDHSTPLPGFYKVRESRRLPHF